LIRELVENHWDSNVNLSQQEDNFLVVRAAVIPSYQTLNGEILISVLGICKISVSISIQGRLGFDRYDNAAREVQTIADGRGQAA
jgi:hypothetical protein